MKIAEITIEERSAFLKVLEQCSETLGNAGCNDFEIPDTSGNRDFLKAVEKHCDPDEDFDVCVQDGQLIGTDFMVLDYLVSIIKASTAKG